MSESLGIKRSVEEDSEEDSAKRLKLDSDTKEAELFSLIQNITSKASFQEEDSDEEYVPVPPIIASKESTNYEETVSSNYDALLEINYQYQNVLKETLEYLTEKLNRNLNKQKELENESRSLTKSEEISNIQTVKTNSIKIFYFPYFKDKRLFTHPDNPDTAKMRREGNLYTYNSIPSKFSEADKKKLKLAIREDCIYKRTKELLDQENTLVRAEDTEDNRLSLKRVREAKSAIENNSDEELFPDPDENFDWPKIVIQTFNCEITEKYAELMWKNLLRPNINKSTWSTEEDTALASLVEINGRQNWIEICSILGTSRTPFLCFIRYQRKHFLNLISNVKWTKEEDNKLRSLVNQYRVRNHIPWTKIGYHMGGFRTKNMCYHRYKYKLCMPKKNSGHFTTLEDCCLYVGQKIFGNNFKDIHRYIPSRNPLQLSARFSGFTSLNSEPWTPDEDYKLLQLVQNIGTVKWQKVSEHFENKNRIQCKNRLYSLFRRFRKVPGNFDLNALMNYESNGSSLGGKRLNAIYEYTNNRLANFCDAYISDEDDESEPSYDPNKSRIESTIDLNRQVQWNTGEIISVKLLLNFFKYITQEFFPKSSVKKKVVRKPLKPPTVKDLNLDKLYALFFLPTYGKRIGRQKCLFDKYDKNIFTEVLRGLSLLLKCTDLKVSELNSPSTQFENHLKDLFDFLKVPEDDLELKIRFSDTSGIRTYSRKKPQTDSEQETTETCDLITPNLATCIGLRGIILSNFYCTEPYRSKSYKNRYTALKEGIYSNDLNTSVFNLHKNTSIDFSTSKAEDLLFTRFKALFFWPAVISTLKSNYGSLCLDNDCKISAEDPLIIDSEAPPLDLTEIVVHNY